MKNSIALGFGNNIDYELEWSSLVVEKLIKAWGVTDKEIIDIFSIKTERDLLISILGFFKNGSGGERFVENSKILEDFSRYFKKKITIGGTCPRAAIAMSRLGKSSFVHLVTMNDQMRELLPPEIEWVCSNIHDSSYPHVIIQFDAGVTVQANDIKYKTPHANRIIYNNNPDSMTMAINPVFFTKIVEETNVLLISGFNAMRDEKLLKERLGILKEHLLLLKKNQTIQVFYEDACFHEHLFSALVQFNLCPYIDVFSMNEDELQTYIGEELDFLDAQSIFNAVKFLHRKLGIPYLVVHSRHWALIYGEGAVAYSKCLNSGIAMATTRFRFGDNFNETHFKATCSLTDDAKGAAFSDLFSLLSNGSGFCLPSKIVPETRVTTIGLGDAFVGGFLLQLTDLVNP